MRLVFTEEQRSWVSRNFLKIAKSAKDSNKKRILHKIGEAFLSSKDSVEVSTTESKTILKAAAIALSALDAAEKKYNEDPVQFKTYLEAIPSKREMLKSIEEKIQRNLK